MSFVHFDEAKMAAEKQIQKWLNNTPQVEKVLVVWDLLGKCRLAVWADSPIDTDSLEQNLQTKCQAWWSGDIFRISEADRATRLLYDKTWEQFQGQKLAILDRHRSRTMWFQNQDAPTWQAPDDGPPIIVFYSFKGGLGRSTILASFAIQRAIEGERACILDFDLDSPGVGSLLSADSNGLTASWGIVDFLLESNKGDVPLSDYYHRCDRVAGEGEISVFPVGKVNESYADKLARVDMETDSKLGLEKLLVRIRNELEPQWILIDARTGISASAGLLLSGIAHLHVITGSASEQSWQGLNLVIDRFGQAQIMKDQSQTKVILVHGMVPANPAGCEIHKRFQLRAEDEFNRRYYNDSDHEDEEGEFVSVQDTDNHDAPSAAIRVNYNQDLVSIRDIKDIAESLGTGAYSVLAERIVEQFIEEDDI